MDHTSEQKRQSALMAAILSFEPVLPSGWQAPPHVDQPLHAHQGHVRVLAAKLLAQAFPKLQQLLPPEIWPYLAQTFWQQHPPTNGNLNTWGADLPDWLTSPAWQAWPDLAQTARLDWTIHDSQMAGVVEVEHHTLALLGDPHVSPDTLCMQLQPGVRLLPHACVLGAHVEPVDGAWHAFMKALLAEQAQGAPTLGRLLEQHMQAFPAFDFTAWLTAALTHGWVWRIKSLSG